MRRALALGAAATLLMLAGCSEPITLLTPSPGATLWTPPASTSNPEAAADTPTPGVRTTVKGPSATPSPSTRPTPKR